MFREKASDGTTILRGGDLAAGFPLELVLGVGNLTVNNTSWVSFGDGLDFVSRGPDDKFMVVYECNYGQASGSGAINVSTRLGLDGVETGLISIASVEVGQFQSAGRTQLFTGLAAGPHSVELGGWVGSGTTQIRLGRSNLFIHRLN